MTVLPKVQELSTGADKTDIKGIVEIRPVSPLDRTISQDVAARTGRSRVAARAALDALADDPQRDEKAYNMLMSNLILTVVDGLPCDAVTLRHGEAAWLPTSCENAEEERDASSVTTVADVGGFGDCYLLRIARGREEELRIFALEPVQVLLLKRQEGALWRDRSIDIAPGWQPASMADLAHLPVLSDDSGDSKWLEVRNFDPGYVTIPLQAGDDIIPLLRILKKPEVSAVRPPANSFGPSTQAQDDSQSQSQPFEVLPPVPEEDGEELDEQEEEAATAAEVKRASPKVSPRETAEASDSQHPAAKAKVERSRQRARKHGLKERRKLDQTYTLGSRVGEGAFGTVFLAEAVAKDDSCSKQKVAVKCVLPATGAKREVAILQRLQHPCIISLLDWYAATSDGKQALHIVMEFVPSNLHKQIGGHPLAETDLRCYSWQLLRAIAHLDGLGISHRDLKPQNILVDGLALKLADFGSAKELDGKCSQSYICSRWWRAPELILGSSGYSTGVDWWACGCVIAEMMLGKALFRGASNWGQMFEIISVLGPPTLEDLRALCPEGCKQLEDNLARLTKAHRSPTNWAAVVSTYAGHPLALQLLSQLLVWDPRSRLHPARALSHGFFAEIFNADRRPSAQFLYAAFTAEELSSLSPEVKAKFHDLEERHRPMNKRENPDDPASQAADDNGRQATLDSMDVQDTKRRRLAPEQVAAEMPEPVKVAEIQDKELEDPLELARDPSTKSDASMRSVGSALRRDISMVSVSMPDCDIF